MPQGKQQIGERGTARSLRELKRRTGWSWERMSREFRQVMEDEGPSQTTLFRYATGRVRQRNLVLSSYVEVAVEKIRKRLAEEQIRASEERRKDAAASPGEGIEAYRILLKAVPNGVIFLTRDGRIQELNREAEALLGVVRASVLGQDYVELFVPEERRPTARARLEDVFSGGAVGAFECQMAASDGTEMCVLWKLGPLTGTEGQVLTAVMVGQDITRQYLLKRALGALLDGVSSAAGRNLPGHLVKALSRALKVRMAFLSRLKSTGDKVKLLALWDGKDFGDVFEYGLEGTPCRLVFENGIAFFPSRVQESFPLDGWLRTKGVESYLAVPVLGSAGQPLGHLGIMHDRPLSPRLPAEAVLRAFSERVPGAVQIR